MRRVAGEVAPVAEDDFDDICQFFRVKVWKILDAFDPSRVKTTSKYTPAEQLERFVYACLQNAKKDVLKKKRHGVLFIEDLAPLELEEGTNGVRDRFELRYLSIEDAFVEAHREPPLIPSTLNQLERQVVLLTFLDFEPAEIALAIGVTRKKVWSMMKGIREKMADWAPGSADEQVPLAA